METVRTISIKCEMTSALRGLCPWTRNFYRMIDAAIVDCEVYTCK